MIYDLFPQPVGIYKLDRVFTKNELNFIKKQKTRLNNSNLVSIDTNILYSSLMVKVKMFIENAIKDYVATIYNPSNNVSLKITQSWCNYTNFGESHHIHAHPNSFISGVMYIQADKNIDKIYFYRGGFQQIELPPKEWNMWNSNSWWLPVETGDLLLFPSSLQHSVETIKSERTRISLSFNTFPIGDLGCETTLTRLNISGVNV